TVAADFGSRGRRITSSSGISPEKLVSFSTTATRRATARLLTSEPSRGADHRDGTAVHHADRIASRSPVSQLMPRKSQLDGASKPTGFGNGNRKLMLSQWRATSTSQWAPFAPTGYP